MLNILVMIHNELRFLRRCSWSLIKFSNCVGGRRRRGRCGGGGGVPRAVRRDGAGAAAAGGGARRRHGRGAGADGARRALLGRLAGHVAAAPGGAQRARGHVRGAAARRREPRPAHQGGAHAAAPGRVRGPRARRRAAAGARRAAGLPRHAAHDAAALGGAARPRGRRGRAAAPWRRPRAALQVPQDAAGAGGGGAPRAARAPAGGRAARARGRLLHRRPHHTAHDGSTGARPKHPTVREYSTKDQRDAGAEPAPAAAAGRRRRRRRGGVADAGKLMLKESEGEGEGEGEPPAKRAKGVVLTATPVRAPPRAGVKVFALNNRLVALPREGPGLPARNTASPQLKQVKIVQLGSDAKIISTNKTTIPLKTAAGGAASHRPAVKIFMNKTNFNKLLANSDRSMVENIETEDGLAERSAGAGAEARTLEEDVEEILRVREEFLLRCSGGYARAHALAARRALHALKARLDRCQCARAAR